MSIENVVDSVSDGWVSRLAQETGERFMGEYTGEHGLLMTLLGGEGQVLDGTPLLEDLGDTLPYLYYFGFGEFALEQVRRARPYLWQGLYNQDGRVRAFLNHDFLLGLIELYELCEEDWLLQQSLQAARTLVERLSVRGMVVNEIRPAYPRRRWFPRASPFNGGYIEVLVDLANATHDPSHLESARTMALAWAETPFFQHHGLFRRIEIVGSEPLSRMMSYFSRGGLVRLFKDNTNLVYSLLALSERTGEGRWVDALERWLASFRRWFWNDGNVYLLLDRGFRGYEPHLKAGFSALDLLCDLYAGGVGGPSTLELARAIGDFWLEQQWPNGLFPQVPGGSVDHLDANTDLVVALHKLSRHTGEKRYLQAGIRCRKSLLAHHAVPAGYAMSVDYDGRVVDDSVTVKYQGLLLKLALLADGDAEISPAISRLLRDR